MKKRFAAMVLAGVLSVGLVGSSVCVSASDSAAESTDSVTDSTDSVTDSTESGFELIIGGKDPEDAGESGSLFGSALGEDDSSLLVGALGLISEALEKSGRKDALGSDGTDGDASCALGGLGEKASEVIGNITQYLQQKGEEAKDFADGLLNSDVVSGIGESLSETLDGLKSSFADKLTDLEGLLKSGGDEANAFFESIGEAIGGKEDGGSFDLNSFLDQVGLSDPEAGDSFVNLTGGSSYGSLDEAITYYLADKNRDVFEPSDVTVVVPVIAGMSEGDHPGEYTVLGDYWQFNFDQDGSCLDFVSGGNTTGSLSLIRDEEGNWTVTDSRLFVDENDLVENLEELCDQAGITEEEFYDRNSSELASLGLYLNLIDLSRSLTDLDSFQVDGDVYTFDEAEQYVLDYIAGQPDTEKLIEKFPDYVQELFGAYVN